jgi:hypothetical protein
VHAVAFFNKLAEYGIKPSTEQEAKELLELGFKLAAVPQQPAPHSKQASAFGVALDALKQVTGEPTSGEASRTNEIYAYANHFMQDAASRQVGSFAEYDSEGLRLITEDR